MGKSRISTRRNNWKDFVSFENFTFDYQPHFRRNAADDCPAETEWTVKNLDSWVTVKNFARCQGENDEDQQAFKLSYTVCDLIQETEGKNLGDRMRNALQKRKNTLCNRAMNHARVS